MSKVFTVLLHQGQQTAGEYRCLFCGVFLSKECANDYITWAMSQQRHLSGFEYLEPDTNLCYYTTHSSFLNQEYGYFHDGDYSGSENDEEDEGDEEDDEETHEESDHPMSDD